MLPQYVRETLKHALRFRKDFPEMGAMKDDQTLAKMRSGGGG